MPASTETIITFDGQEEPNLAKFEIEHESVMHDVNNIGTVERMETLPGKMKVTIHVWVNGISHVLDQLHMLQTAKPGFQTVISVTYADDSKSTLAYDDCAMVLKTIKGEAKMPTWSYYRITSTRERVSS